MMIIPGFLIGLLTFPGVVVHEAAHLLFCRIAGLAVLDVRFFQLRSPAGYVIHEKPGSFTAAFFVDMGPFIVNSALCVLFCLAAFAPVWVLGIGDPLQFFFLWLGLSIGMHAFPSGADLQQLWSLAPGAAKTGHPLALLALPLIAILYPLNFLRVVWIDLVYGVVIGLALPGLLFDLLV